MTDRTRNLFRKAAEQLRDLTPLPEDKRPYHAVFSLAAAMEYGSGIWAREDGTEVEVTCVDRDRDNLYAIYGWPDKVYVGLVTKRLRQGWPDTTRFIYSPHLPE